jgi:tetratricopeptide (TPR) repeat protein
MGTLLETDSGTGLVPVRAVIGWGPESMFVAYNQFYPPSLANIEARGASPDRSHEAYLDELVTKGLLGLISYLFVLISFFTLAWRLVRRVDDWRMQMLFIAAIAIVAAHSVEGLTGIPIVSTLMMLWLTMAVVVVAGALAGQYSLDAAPAVVAEAAPAPATAEPAKGQPANRGGRRRPAQGAAPRGAAQGRAVRGRARAGGGASSSAALALYSVIGLLALMGVWFFNADNVYADMRFQQGQSLSDNPSSSLEQQLVGAGYYLDAIRMEPRQDFYYLNLGRGLMAIAETKRQMANGQIGQPKPDASVADLLRMDTRQAEQVVLQQSPLETLSYARAVLERAREINPMNKDHYANLGRLHNFWYSRISQDPQQLQDAIRWYEQAHAVAPQDVVILNEYASAVALMGNYQRGQNNEAAAQERYEQANQLLAQSKQLDARYSDTDLRIAEVLRLQGRSAEATDQYVELIEANPHAIDGQVTQIADSLSDQPDQLRRLRDAYAAAMAANPEDAALYSFVGLISVRLGEYPQAADAFGRWIQLQPDSIDARRNYTLVLSETQQYPQATAEAEALLSLAQRQQRSQEEQLAIQGLVDFLKDKSAVGG